MSLLANDRRTFPDPPENVPTDSTVASSYGYVPAPASGFGDNEMRRAAVVATRVHRYTFSRRCEAMALRALGQVPEWLNGPDCKSGAKATVVRIRPCPPRSRGIAPGRCHGPT